jgi:two-component system phosphate regulon sensor histidine kinase PhoR
MKRSIFFKVFGGYLLIILAFAVLVLVFSSRAIKTFYLDTLSHNLEDLGRSLKFKAVPLLEEGRIGELDTFVKEFGKSIRTRITIVDKEGVVLADSDENPEIMENHKFRPEIYRALAGDKGQSIRYSDTVQADMLYVGLPIEMNGQIVGALRVSLYLKDVSRLFSSLRANIWRIVGLITVLSLLGAFIFARSLSRPMKELRYASQRIASGDFDAKVLLKKGRDELRELADSFNFMSEQIKDLFTQLSRQKEELDSILSSMEEGLLALDKDGKIIFSNESFEKIIDTERVEGKLYWEVLREPKFGELIRRIQEEKKNLAEEIMLKERTFLCRAAFLPSREEIVVTLLDLTRTRDIEKIKKDFVVNVSHELRTPLTAIKGYVETLYEEADVKSRNYLEIIRKHTDRLINIVKDLLFLSELEEKGFMLQIEKLNLKVLIENILKIFEQELKEKKLKAELRAEADLPLIEGDPFKLEQMFINIIDNAVKYTKKGKITISLKKEDRNARIEIQDTGIGVPKEHLDRIFERFYVIDKSRSKKLGGTGLGLSIVRHIALLHDGDVSVKSTPDKGTTFTILLPL